MPLGLMGLMGLKNLQMTNDEVRMDQTIVTRKL